MGNTAPAPFLGQASAAPIFPKHHQKCHVVYVLAVSWIPRLVKDKLNYATKIQALDNLVTTLSKAVDGLGELHNRIDFF